MDEKGESLKELLGEIEHYSDLLNQGPLSKPNLIRSRVVNWQFYKVKTENAKTKTMKLRNQEKRDYYWGLYSSLFSSSENPIYRNHNQNQKV